MDRSCLSLLVCPGVSNLRNLLRNLGTGADRYPVHHRSRNGSCHLRLGSPQSWYASRIVRRVDLGAQPFFLSLASFLDLGLHGERISAFRCVHRHTGRCGEEQQKTLASVRRNLGIDCANQSRIAQRDAIHVCLRWFRKSSRTPEMARAHDARRCPLRSAGIPLADSQRTRVRPPGFLSQQLLV